MKRYSLQQLSVFVDHGMGRARMRDMAEVCGQPPGSAIGYSDRMRSCDLVGLYHDQGGEIGADIERYIDHVLVAHAHLLPDGGDPSLAPTYTLGELCWVRAVGMFSGDVKRDLLAAGVDEASAASVSLAARTAQGDVVKWYKLSGEDALPAVHANIASALQSYKAGWPFAVAQATREAAAVDVSPEPSL